MEKRIDFKTTEIRKNDFKGKITGKRAHVIEKAGVPRCKKL